MPLSKTNQIKNARKPLRPSSNESSSDGIVEIDGRKITISNADEIEDSQGALTRKRIKRKRAAI